MGNEHLWSRALVVAAVLICAKVALAEPRAPLTEDQTVAVADHNAFAFDLYQELRGAGGDNMLVSPFSVSTALAMTYAGAQGRTAEQMAEALRFTLPDDRLHAALGGLASDLDAPHDGYTLSIANRIFGQHDAPFKQPFLDTNESAYQAPLEFVDFAGNPEGARDHVNQWVADQTNDRIQDLLPAGSVNELTRIALANAIYFTADWRSQFDPNKTRDAPFHTGAGESVQTPLMHQRGHFRHGSFGGYEMLEIPYEGEDLSMVVVLPDDQDGLGELESQLTAETFDQNVAALERRDVEAYLPRFRFRSEFDLVPSLQSMGMTDAFNQATADFSGILDRPAYDLHLTGVYHKTFIDVDESGTEAAGATGVVGGITSVPPPAPEFRADHPFLFALRDTHSGALLFMGSVNEPEIVGGTNLATGLPGDFNSDGFVDAADYAVWRDNLGAPAGALPNDPHGGPIGQGQYDVWRANVGAAAGSADGGPVPEPAGALLLLLAAAVGAAARRRLRVAGCSGCV